MTERARACAIPGLGPEAYVGWRASEIGRITDHLERRVIRDLVGDVRGLRVLDVGCGDGRFTVKLAQSGASVVGIDASPAMVAAGQA